jgi:hypothetical protein
MLLGRRLKSAKTLPMPMLRARHHLYLVQPLSQIVPQPMARAVHFSDPVLARRLDSFRSWAHYDRSVKRLILTRNFHFISGNFTFFLLYFALWIAQH